MILAVGLDQGMTGRMVAWALDHPGCFAYGADPGDAIVAMPQAFIKYKDWISDHTGDSWLTGSDPFDVRLVETFQTYRINRDFEVTAGEGTEINAWFQHDWRPLSMIEVRRAQSMLAWSRADLLSSVVGLDAEQLDRLLPGQRWTIRGILAHVATTEWWYLDRLGLAGGLPRASLPKDPHQRLGLVRTRLDQAFPSLAGSSQAVGVEGEFWSPRKLLRRLLWHELDHVGHIYQLILS
jgi:hypothetical protein